MNPFSILAGQWPINRDYLKMLELGAMATGGMAGLIPYGYGKIGEVTGMAPEGYADRVMNQFMPTPQFLGEREMSAMQGMGNVMDDAAFNYEQLSQHGPLSPILPDLPREAVWPVFDTLDMATGMAAVPALRRATTNAFRNVGKDSLHSLGRASDEVMNSVLSGRSQTPLAQRGMVAWHGSPHKHSGRLDPTKIGTGEGTRNFVIFPGNEDLVKPLSRNGEPLGILGDTLKGQRGAVGWDGDFDLPPVAKGMTESGRYTFKPVKDGGRTSLEYNIEGVDNWDTIGLRSIDPDTGRVYKTRESLYDPDIVSPKKSSDEWGDNVEWELKEGWNKEVPQNDDYIYRGMSWEEYENIQKTGKIQSKGDYNFENQKGLTYYSNRADQASNYAHGFAPVQFQASPSKPAVVVAVPKRKGVKVTEGYTDEVGVPSEIDASEIKEVWIGKPYSTSKSGGVMDVTDSYGNPHDGTSFPPSVSVAWKKQDSFSTPEPKWGYWPE